MLTIFDWNFEVWAVQKYANLGDLMRSRQELSNEYVFVKIRFDTAENEPLKVFEQIF